MKVISDQGKTLGVLHEILDTGANDVFVVHSLEFGEILLPYTDEVITNINLERNEMHVHLLPGLLGKEQEE
jgi:16S rRNA processing protein RimM